MNQRKFSYSEYRSFGHTKPISIMLSISIEFWIFGGVIVGLLTGFYF